jgi:hypothetical protein
MLSLYFGDQFQAHRSLPRRQERANAVDPRTRDPILTIVCGKERKTFSEDPYAGGNGSDEHRKRIDSSRA